MYQVTFIDGTEFTGGEPESSMWDNLPNKPIKSILYWLNEEIKFLFTDFEEYGHIVERAQVFNRSNPAQRPQENVTKAIIMGRVGKRVYQVVFDLNRGQIHQLVCPWGQEYSNREFLSREGVFQGWIDGKPVGGWLQGILNDGSGPGPKLKRIE